MRIFTIYFGKYCKVISSFYGIFKANICLDLVSNVVEQVCLLKRAKTVEQRERGRDIEVSSE